MSLQEVRMPKDKDWTISNGYLFCQSSCAIGLRNDIGKKWDVDVVAAERFHIHIKTRHKDGGEECNVLNIYIPPAGSRFYDDD